MKIFFVLVILTMIVLALLAGVTAISPTGWQRLRHLGFWFTVAGMFVPPLIFTIVTVRKSEDPALWLMMTGGTTLVSGIVGYIAGLFLPSTWPLWANLALGVIPWSVFGAFVLLKG